MDDTMKKAIAQLIEQAIPGAGSQEKFATRHKVSGATISNIRNGKWNNIAPAMWQRMAAAVGYRGKDWQVAATRNFNAMVNLCKTAQTEGISIGVSHDSGTGKTFALTQYAAGSPEVFYIQCDEFWTKKLFLSNIYRALGHDPALKTTPELADGIITALRKCNKPLIILDEVDKLRDVLTMYFISLYNKLDGICGFVLVGAPYLRNAWERNAKKDKRGFREIYSRIGRRFISLAPLAKKDVEMVCQVNGVSDPVLLASIWNEVETNVDLRRVRREVEKTRYNAAA